MCISVKNRQMFLSYIGDDLLIERLSRLFLIAQLQFEFQICPRTLSLLPL